MIDEKIIEDYAHRLIQTQPEDSFIVHFREKHPDKFEEICFLQLSFIIDVPWDIISGKSSKTQTATPKSGLRRLFSKTNNEVCLERKITDQLANNIVALMDRIDTDKVLHCEGVFRKNGNLLRYRVLRDAVLQSVTSLSSTPSLAPEMRTNTTVQPAQELAVDWDEFTPHDLANSLKAVLVRLPSPLLTDRLMPLFIRLAEMNLLHSENEETFGDTKLGLKYDEVTYLENNRSPAWLLARAKWLKAMRLLCQLMPAPNRQLLQRLLLLLYNVVYARFHNRMGITALGTLFGPVLFTSLFTEHNSHLQDKHQDEQTQPKRNGVCDQKCNLGATAPVTPNSYTQLTRLIGLAILSNNALFELPQSLVEDLYCNKPATDISSNTEVLSLLTSCNNAPRLLRQNNTAATVAHSLQTTSLNKRLNDCWRRRESDEYSLECQDVKFDENFDVINNLSMPKLQSNFGTPVDRFTKACTTPSGYSSSHLIKQRSAFFNSLKKIDRSHTKQTFEVSDENTSALYTKIRFAASNQCPVSPTFDSKLAMPLFEKSVNKTTSES